MTAPPCLWCQSQPVAKVYGAQAKACSRPGWRNFCSRKCAGEHAHAMQSPEVKRMHTERMVAWNRDRHVRTVVAQIKKVLGEDFTDGTPITIKQAIALVRWSYKRGCFTTYQRMCRERERAA